ncbi:COPZ1 protein, partial [Galbula dea]|nr:COPZ1 protein [Galbula dea]
DGPRCPLSPQYYDDIYPSVKEQKAFEKNIFSKTHRTDSEIALLEGLTVVYKSSIDLYFYVIGSSYENEVAGGTQGAPRGGQRGLEAPRGHLGVTRDTRGHLGGSQGKNVEKRALLENMEGLFLAVDEIVDGG